MQSTKQSRPHSTVLDQDDVPTLNTGGGASPAHAATRRQGSHGLTFAAVQHARRVALEALESEPRPVVLAPRGFEDAGEVDDTVRMIHPPGVECAAVEAGAARSVVMAALAAGVVFALAAGLAVVAATPTPASAETVRQTSTPAGGVRALPGHPGITVSVDGVAFGALPLFARNLPAGEHLLRFEGGDGFEAVTRRVEVVSGEIEDLGLIELPLRNGTLTVDVDGVADVWLRRGQGPAERVAGPWPRALALEPGDYELVASRYGHRSIVRPVHLDAMRPRQTVRIALEPTDWQRFDLWTREELDRATGAASAELDIYER